MKPGDVFVDGAGKGRRISAVDVTNHKLTLNDTDPNSVCQMNRQPSAGIYRDNLARTTNFWFGKVNNTQALSAQPPKPSNVTQAEWDQLYPSGSVKVGDNYIETKVGYDSREIFLNSDVVDRRIWHEYHGNDGAVDPMQATQYDSLSYYFNVTGVNPARYKFDVLLSYH
jgi:hypothetical protein